MAARSPSSPPVAPPLRSKRRNSLNGAAAVMPVPATWRQLARDQKAFDAAAREATIANTAFTAATKIGDVKRWDGTGRRTTTWDDLRRDEELWSEDGDCFIHLAARGHSRRGPSFRVKYDEILARKCEPMFDLFSVPQLPEGPELTDSTTDSPISSSDDGSPGDAYRHGVKYDIYIPAPRNLSRDESFRFHLCTRNFFAWMFGKPMVGSHLGGALVDLLERMRVFRTVDSLNVKDIVDYLNMMGYSDFRECPNHALAVLYFAEHCQVLHLWRDAFVHCVGMNERLIFSSEFEPISKTTKALITRAKLEMDLRLDHAGHSLGSFLEEDVTGKSLGLSKDASAHLDHFRSFLQSYYVNKFGYYPPQPTARHNNSFTKEMYRSMYFEFRSLYQFLVDDSTSLDDVEGSQPAAGFSLSQSIKSFDHAHHYNPLPRSHPRLPRVAEWPQNKPRKSHSPFSTISNLIGKSKRPDLRPAILSALADASNSERTTDGNHPLVDAFIAFETESTVKSEVKLSPIEGRQIRWLLIYAVLQTLVSVTRAPREVSDTSGVTYSLCCQLAGTPPWQSASPEKASSTSSTTSSSNDSFLSRSLTVSIHRSSFSPRTTTSKELAAIQPRRIVAVDELGVRKSVLDRLSPTSIYSSPSSAASSPVLSHPQPQRPRLNYSQIVLKGYGNGTSASTPTKESLASSSPTSPSSSAGGGDCQSSYFGRSSTAATTDNESSGDASSGVDDMDHLSVTSSFYGDEDDECVPNPLVVRKGAADGEAARVETEEFIRMNSELERYVAA